METTGSFGYWIRRQRKALDLTQQVLAERVGCSVAAIKKIESDERRPSRQIAERLADLLGVPAGQREMFLEVARGIRPIDQLSLAQGPVISSLPTGTVTFLFTDIEDSTKLAQQHSDAMPTLLTRHHEILQQSIQMHNGYVFQVVGDEFAAAFHSASDALNAALMAQHLLHNETWSPAPIKVRMGIHTGAAQLQDASKAFRYSGYATIALTQRIMSAGHGGQILLSDATENLLSGHLPKDVSLLDLGEHKFKNILQPVRVFQAIAPDLQKEFPALRAQDVLLNNLPIQLTSFIGREKEIADVIDLLKKARLVTLTGPGGTGKTRLSIQVANELLDQYPDGVWIVELAPISDPLLLPRTTAIAIGLRDEPQRPVIDMLCDYLHEKRMLIILDNCEHLIEACAQMADKILHTAPNVHILASSREALGIAGEVTYRVPSLGLPDTQHLPPFESLSQYEAIKLFIDRAASALPTFTVTNENALALAQICFRLDGIPLAIELAAAKVRVLSVEQIAKRLDDRFRLLTGGSRTFLERHQTLRAAIDWSYNLLSSAEQVFFRRLSVFVNGWTLEAAESICADETIKSEEVLNLLEQLINKSLVIKEEIQSETRYRISETIRQYANEKLVDSDESDALRDKHLEYFLNLAETAEPHLIRYEQLDWLAQLDADYENLRLALKWALSKDSPELSLRLCAALGPFWYLRTYWLEGSKWLGSALSKSSRTPGAAEKIARARALYQDARLAYELDDIERMKTSAELSLLLAQKGKARRDIAIARFYVGFALGRHNRFDHARPLIEQSLAEFRELKDSYWEAYSFRRLGSLLKWEAYSFRQLGPRLKPQGKLKFGEWDLQALELARKAGERLNLAEALWSYSNLFYISYRFNEGMKYVEEADMLYTQIGSRVNLTSLAYGTIAWLNGDYESARSYFEELQERLRLLGEKVLRSDVISRLLGCLTLEKGDLEQAQAYFEEALTTARELQNQSFIVFRLAELSNVFYLCGNIDKYKQYLREGIRAAKLLTGITKMDFLLIALNSIYVQSPMSSTHILGVIYTSERDNEHPIAPLEKRYYDRAEAYARETLGNAAFESAFVEGQKMSLDEALELVLKTLEEM